MKLSSENNNMDKEFEAQEESLKTKIISEVFKRKIIKDKARKINSEVNSKKDEYIEELKDKLNDHTKKIDEAAINIEKSIESNDIEELQRSFQNMLDSIKD